MTQQGPLHPLLTGGAEYPFVKLERRRKELAPPGVASINFGMGDPREETPRFIRDTLKAALPAVSSYPATAGKPELRAACAAWMKRRYGVDLDPERHVLPANGTKEAVFTMALAVVAPGGVRDTVVIPTPAYPVYEGGARFAGAKPHFTPLQSSDGWRFNPDRVSDEVWKRTALLWLNSPHNPTGGILARRDLEAIAAILRGHPDVWVYADEIYSRLCYEGEFFSIASVPGMYERTIVSDGASKTWAMTGWRLGLTANPVLAAEFTRWVTNTDSCASQISQWAAVAAIEGPQDDAAKMRASFLDRRDLIVGLLNQVPGVTCRTPGGAFYAWPNVTEACRIIGAADSEEFRRRLLNDAGVAVLADIHFGARVPGEGQHVRFSYAASKSAIESGVARMTEFIKRNARRVA